MAEQRPVDKIVLERGRWFRDQLADPDSPLVWALAELADHEERAKNSLLGIVPGLRPTQPLEYLSGRYHGLGIFREIVDDAVRKGGEEAIRFAENRETGPLTQETAPNRG